MKYSKYLAVTFISILSFFIFNNLALANNNKFLQNPKVQRFIQQTAKHDHFSPSYLRSVLSHVYIDQSIIDSMNRPYEALPWYTYHNLFITPERIQGGVNFWQQHAKVLAQAQRIFGVPANIIVAIIGVESRYGTNMGTHSVLNALSTLAFYYPSRTKFFTKELADYLVMAREMRLNPLDLKGSYAGAMGMCQFMPSSYLNYAVDYHAYLTKTARHANLFTKPQDAIFSVANYLMKNGWQRNQPITTAAFVKGNRANRVIKADSRKPMKPKLSLAYLQKLGIKPAGDFKANTRAYVMQLKLKNGVEYWLGFANFYAITRYNNSDLYAMAVYQLAQRITAARDELLRRENHRRG